MAKTDKRSFRDRVKGAVGGAVSAIKRAVTKSSGNIPTQYRTPTIKSLSTRPATDFMTPAPVTPRRRQFGSNQSANALGAIGGRVVSAPRPATDFMTPAPVTPRRPATDFMTPAPVTPRPATDFMTPAPVTPRPRQFGSNQSANALGAIGGRVVSAPRPATDFMTPRPPERPTDTPSTFTEERGSPATERTESYTLPGSSNPIKPSQLSEQQSANIAQLKTLGEQLQAAQEALATAGTEEERNVAGQEEQRADREYAQAERAYERLLRESEGEVQAQTGIDALSAQSEAINAQYRSESADVKNQPIPAGFITGQDKALYEKAQTGLGTLATQKIPLEQQLSREQAKRQSAIDVSKQRLTSLENKRSRYDYRRKERKSDLKDKQDRERDERKYQEDVRRYGLDYAQNERRINQANREKTTPKFRVSSSDIDQGTSALEQSRGSDGFVDTALYTNLYRDWIDGGGSRSEFLNYFPSNSYLNPNDPTVPAYLRPTGSGGNWRG